MGRSRAFRAVTGGASGDYVGTGLVMWLDGADTSKMTRTVNRVDAWTDKLGSGNAVATGLNGTGFNPSYVSTLFNNQGGVRFLGGSFHYLETAAAFTTMNWTTGFTILVAGQFKSASATIGCSEGSNSIFGTAMDMRLGTGSYWLTREGAKLSTDCVFGVVCKTTMRAAYEGSVLPVREGTAALGSGAFGKLQIGGLVPGSTMSMDVRAIFIYNRELSNAEIASMTRWIRSTCGFTAIPQSAYNIVVDGNSLACGYSGTTAYPMYDGMLAASPSINGSDYLNVATSGIVTSALTSRAATTVDSLLNAGLATNRKILLIWEITNDLATGVQTAAGAYANIKAYCQARRTAGWGKIVVFTCLPRSNAGLRAGFETDRQTVNTNIVTNAVAEGWADYVADIGADATIGVAGASDNATYYPDKIHLTNAGVAIAKTYVTAAMNAVLA
jgi:lysophospholipase L1-like esterase